MSTNPVGMVETIGFLISKSSLPKEGALRLRLQGSRREGVRSHKRMRQAYSVEPGDEMMSARMEVESVRWKTSEAIDRENLGKSATEMEMECLIRNFDQKDLVAPLRNASSALAGTGKSKQQVEEKRRAALALQEQWEALLTRRELLKSEIKRGKECLQQVQQELATLKDQLEEWPAFERICGKNPLGEYMQAITSKERIEKFLPGWLKRQEEQLQTLSRKIERCAKQNGLEHLL